MVLDDGKIVELGTHDELYSANGIYTKIYNTMFKAQTKSKDRLEKRRQEAQPIETKFSSLPATDAKALEKYYKVTYEDEDKRIKAEEKAAQRIEKDQIKEQIKEQKIEKQLEKQVQKEEKQLERQSQKMEKQKKKVTENSKEERE